MKDVHNSVLKTSSLPFSTRGLKGNDVLVVSQDVVETDLKRSAGGIDELANQCAYRLPPLDRLAASVPHGVLGELGDERIHVSPTDRGIGFPNDLFMRMRHRPMIGQPPFS
jgi:hypothetical protein